MFLEALFMFQVRTLICQFYVTLGEVGAPPKLLSYGHKQDG